MTPERAAGKTIGLQARLDLDDPGLQPRDLLLELPEPVARYGVDWSWSVVGL